LATGDNQERMIFLWGIGATGESGSSNWVGIVKRLFQIK